jgi:hypothetical protein
MHRRLSDLPTGDRRANAGRNGPEIDRRRAAEPLDPTIVAYLQITLLPRSPASDTGLMPMPSNVRVMSANSG